MTTMADIKRNGGALDLRGSAPKKSGSAAIPAGQLHGKQVSGTGLLDLRAGTAKTVDGPVSSAAKTNREKQVSAATDTTPTPAASASHRPAGVNATQAARGAVQSQPSATILPTPAKPVTPAVSAPSSKPVKPSSIPANAASPQKAPEKPAVNLTPTTSAAATQAQSATPRSPLIKKFDPHPATASSREVLPNQVAAQVDSMKVQAETAPPPPTAPKSPALQQALKAAKRSVNTPKLLQLAAGIAAIGLMAGIVWVQNSPKLAFRNAANQAGIDASLPTYIPSSYHQAGPVSVSPGQITLSFNSPSVNQPLKISQQSSSWDANSLRDNYIAKQTENYLTVQGQGLTIYLYGDQADWINHGVWYQLRGIASLDRQQVLKIVYGL